MAQIQKIDKMPDEVRGHAGVIGRERSAEIKAVANMQVGDVLRMAFDGEEKARIKTRKCLEGWRRRNRKTGWTTLSASRKMCCISRG